MRTIRGRTTLGALAALALIGVAVAAFVATRPAAVRHPTGRVVQGGGPGFDPIRSDEIHTILHEDAIPALTRPPYLAAAAATDIRDDEWVIGVRINGDARAFPVATLSAHEIVNDTIGGQALAVTW